LDADFLELTGVATIGIEVSLELMEYVGVDDFSKDDVVA